MALHVSDFLAVVCGRLTLADDDATTNDECSKKACEIMKHGKNYEGWWTTEDLAKQVVEKVVPIFERCFPNAQALFAFDNATSHTAFAADTLQAKQMNLGRGGKQPQMWPTTYGNGIVQEMCFPPAHPPLLYGEPKGLKIVLEEHGLWQLRLRFECKDNKKQSVQRWKGLLRAMLWQVNQTSKPSAAYWRSCLQNAATCPFFTQNFTTS